MSKHTDPHRIRPEQIAGLLTHAASQLDDGTIAALRQARSAALERQVLHKPAFALSTGHGAHWLVPHGAHQWLATAILLVTVFAGGIGYWHHSNELELSHLDVAILTDELPIEVFLDK